MYTILSGDLFFFFFFFNDTATTEIYTLSLHDALPICARTVGFARKDSTWCRPPTRVCPCPSRDRKSTRLNSSHLVISYAVFCLKKKKKDYNRAHVVAFTNHMFDRSRALPQLETHVLTR